MITIGIQWLLDNLYTTKRKTPENFAAETCDVMKWRSFFSVWVGRDACENWKWKGAKMMIFGDSWCIFVNKNTTI